MFDNIEPNEYILSKSWVCGLLFIVFMTAIMWSATIIVFFVPELTAKLPQQIYSHEIVWMTKSVLTLISAFLPVLFYMEYTGGDKYHVTHLIPRKNFKLRVYYNMYHISCKDYAWDLDIFSRNKFEKYGPEDFIRFKTYHKPDKTLGRVIRYS